LDDFTIKDDSTILEFCTYFTVLVVCENFTIHKVCSHFAIVLTWAAHNLRKMGHYINIHQGKIVSLGNILYEEKFINQIVDEISRMIPNISWE